MKFKDRQKIKKKLKNIFTYFYKPKYPIQIKPKTKIQGTVLFSYLSKPLTWKENDNHFFGPSNTWKSCEIAKIFLERGYSVDAIDWNDDLFVPRIKYDIVFDICYNLARLSQFFDDRTIKILHCTGSDPYYQNAAELARVSALNNRRNCSYLARRLVRDPDLARASMKIADKCALIGNNHTLLTYPEEFRKKIFLITGTASLLGENKKKENYVPCSREFLWFSGSGAVHKGLDLLLEIFPRHPELTLNIIGSLENETLFKEIFQAELLSPNITYAGFLLPNSYEFKQILKRVFCFIMPTCSEGVSTAAATCMQIGLYPIISEDTGITLPPNCGSYLKKCTTNEIESAIYSVLHLTDDELGDQIQKIQEYAEFQFSREKFHYDMESFISLVLDEYKLENLIKKAFVNSTKRN